MALFGRKRTEGRGRGRIRGPKTTTLSVRLAADEADPESVLIFLRSGAAHATLVEHGWEPQEPAENTLVRVGVRGYSYRAADVPEGTMQYRAVSAPRGGGTVEVVLAGPAEALEDGARALHAVAAMVRERFSPATEPEVRGAGA